MQHAPEAHGLGPHVVGQRVVVRRVLPGERGPSGGPAMTDLLGICTAWGETTCVVQPEEGPPVTIELAHIVSGKPVPPRPSVRQRVTVRDAEEHTLHLFPGLETERLGDWVLRTVPVLEGRLVKRANSALAIGDPGVPFDEAVDRVRRFYVDRGRPVLAQVEAGSAVDEALTGLGWSVVSGGDAHFLLGSVARALRAARSSAPAPDGCEVRVAGVGAPQPWDHIRAEAGDVARGEAVLHDDWLGVFGLAVDPDQRRRGLGTAVVTALLERGAEQGATSVWLHVEVDNAPALALYERLGLTVHHTCRYLTPPPA